MKKKVFVVSADIGVSNMFLNRGWEKTNNIKEADLVQFTGGSDVDPELYDQLPHAKTRANPLRDRRESLVFAWARWHSKPMAGICRGAQFLNVMCRGSLYQHVDGHVGPHEAYDTSNPSACFKVTSTHHQMMVPAEEGTVLLWAKSATKWEDMQDNGATRVIHPKAAAKDVEAVLYKEKQVLCFQPHPEWATPLDSRDLYFKYLDNLMET